MSGPPGSARFQPGSPGPAPERGGRREGQECGLSEQTQVPLDSSLTPALPRAHGASEGLGGRGSAGSVHLGDTGQHQAAWARRRARVTASLVQFRESDSAGHTEMHAVPRELGRPPDCTQGSGQQHPAPESTGPPCSSRTPAGSIARLSWDANWLVFLMRTDYAS